MPTLLPHGVRPRPHRGGRRGGRDDGGGREDDGQGTAGVVPLGAGGACEERAARRAAGDPGVVLPLVVLGRGARLPQPLLEPPHLPEVLQVVLGQLVRDLFQRDFTAVRVVYAAPPVA